MYQLRLVSGRQLLMRYTIAFPITTSGAALDETSVDNIFSYCHYTYYQEGASRHRTKHYTVTNDINDIITCIISYI